jgi:NAD-dependent deacetylase
MENNLDKAVDLIVNSKYAIAFTGAGISVESGIPPFRGETGLWSKYDSNVLDLNNFHINPVEAWKVIKEIFYDFFGEAKALGLSRNGTIRFVEIYYNTKH